MQLPRYQPTAPSMTLVDRESCWGSMGACPAPAFNGCRIPLTAGSRGNWFGGGT